MMKKNIGQVFIDTEIFSKKQRILNFLKRVFSFFARKIENYTNKIQSHLSYNYFDSNFLLIGCIDIPLSCKYIFPDIILTHFSLIPNLETIHVIPSRLYLSV